MVLFTHVDCAIRLSAKTSPKESIQVFESETYQSTDRDSECQDSYHIGITSAKERCYLDAFSSAVQLTDVYGCIRLGERMRNAMDAQSSIDGKWSHLMARQPMIEDHKPEDELHGYKKVERSACKR